MSRKTSSVPCIEISGGTVGGGGTLWNEQGVRLGGEYVPFGRKTVHLKQYFKKMLTFLDIFIKFSYHLNMWVFTVHEQLCLKSYI